MDTKTLVKNAEKCSACGGCLTVCPVGAITMQKDAWGCLYPQVDEASCIKCGKCVSVCSYHTPPSRNTPLEAYASVGLRQELVQKSASGGVFATLAQNCIRAAGSVAGAVMDLKSGQADVYHMLSEDMVDIRRMQGSKYVHSQAWRCYADVQKTVKNGKTVLFCGTPCQVAAVKKLTKDPENLITVDLICHGVPPLQMLNDYLAGLAKRFGGAVTAFVFRDKTAGKSFCPRIDIARKKGVKSLFLSASYLSFYTYFLEGATYRENCYCCPYATLNRVSDLTIGDYWGIEDHHSQDLREGRIPERKDWSCILVNTEKGKHFLQKYKENLLLWPTKPEWIAEKNRQLRAPSVKNPKREALLGNYTRKGYSAVEAAFIRESGGRLRFYRRMAKKLLESRGKQSADKQSVL